MNESLTHDMAAKWLWACLTSAGRPLPVNTLYMDRFGFETAPGDPPVVLLNGEVVRDVYLTYNYEEVKHDKWLD